MITTGGVQCLSPYTGYTSIVQGTGQGDRIGNRIEIMNSTMKILFVPQPYHATNNPTPQPQYVNIWLAVVRNLSSVPAGMANCFQSGDSTTSPVGGWLDGLRPFNSDLYLLKKQFMLKLGYAAAVGTGFQAGPQDYANNDSDMGCTLNLDITKYMPKRVIYNDTSGTPESNNLWLFMESVNQDGSAQAAAIIPTHYGLVVSTKFRDD